MKLNLKVVCVVSEENPDTGKHLAQTYYSIDERQARMFFVHDHSLPISHAVVLGMREMEIDYGRYVEYYQPYYEKRQRLQRRV